MRLRKPGSVPIEREAPHLFHLELDLAPRCRRERRIFLRRGAESVEICPIGLDEDVAPAADHDRADLADAEQIVDPLSRKATRTDEARDRQRDRLNFHRVFRPFERCATVSSPYVNPKLY